jgi:hypothetical protein
MSRKIFCRREHFIDDTFRVIDFHILIMWDTPLFHNLISGVPTTAGDLAWG